MLQHANLLNGTKLLSTVNTATQTIVLFGDSITANNGTNSGEVVGIITGITKANPAVVTIAGHLFNTGDIAYVWGVQGMTELNENTYTVTKIDANTFSLNVDSTGFGTYTGYGKTFKTDDGQFSKANTGFFSTADILTRHRCRYLYKHKRGIPGDTTANMNTRKNYELIPALGATIVHVLGGRNDNNSAVSPSTILSNLDSVIAYITGTLGATVILGTIMPNSTNSSTLDDQMDTINAGIQARASSNVLIADYYTAVADSGTRKWKSGYNQDNQHPGPIGAWAMGRVLRDVIAARYGYGAGFTLNAGNVLLNPGMTGTGGSATGITNNGIAANWTATLGGTTGTSLRTVSKDTDGAQIMDVNFASGTGTNTFVLSQTVAAAGLVAGSYYVAEGEVTLESFSGTGAMTELSLTLASNAKTLSVSHGQYTGSPTLAIDTASIIVDGGIRRLRFRTLPVKFLGSYTSLKVALNLRFVNTSGGNQARVKIYNAQLYAL